MLNVSHIITRIKNMGYTKNQLLFIVEGMLTNIVITFASGSYLTGYLVSINMPDALIGIVSISLVWSSIVALGSIFIYQKVANPKSFLIKLFAVSKFLLSFVVILPFIIKSNSAVQVMAVLMVVIGNILTSIFNVGYNVWMMNSVDKQSRVQYIYTRMLFIRIFYALFTIFGGFLMDFFKDNQFKFFIIFGISYVFSLGSLVTLLFTKTKPKSIKAKSKFNFSEFMNPIRDKQYLHFILFIFVFYFSLYLAASFTSLYMLKYIGASYKLISITQLIAFAFQIFSNSFWSRIEQKRGSFFVLKLSALFAVGEFFIFGFINDATKYLLLLSPIVSGIGNGGLGVSLFTHRFSIMPSNTNEEPYEAWYNALLGASALIAPFVGTWIMEVLPNFTNTVFRFSDFQLLYLLAALMASSAVLIMLKTKKKTVK